jgi:hypothetical protein
MRRAKSPRFKWLGIVERREGCGAQNMRHPKSETVARGGSLSDEIATILATFAGMSAEHIATMGRARHPAHIIARPYSSHGEFGLASA